MKEHERYKLACRYCKFWSEHDDFFFNYPKWGRCIRLESDKSPGALIVQVSGYPYNGMEKLKLLTHPLFYCNCYEYDEDEKSYEQAAEILIPIEDTFKPDINSPLSNN